MYINLNSATKEQIQSAINQDSEMQKWFSNKDFETMSVEDARKWADMFFALYAKTLSI